MTVFTVHISDSSPRSACLDVVLVKDGFSWLGALIFFLGISGFGTSGLGTFVAQLGGAVVCGLLANEGRRLYLGWRGLVETDVVISVNKDQAERRFLDAHPDLTARLLGTP